MTDVTNMSEQNLNFSNKIERKKRKTNLLVCVIGAIVT